MNAKQLKYGALSLLLLCAALQSGYGLADQLDETENMFTVSAELALIEEIFGPEDSSGVESVKLPGLAQELRLVNRLMLVEVRDHESGGVECAASDTFIVGSEISRERANDEIDVCEK